MNPGYLGWSNGCRVCLLRVGCFESRVGSLGYVGLGLDCTIIRMACNNKTKSGC